MNRFVKILEKNISGKKVLALFIFTNVVYVFMLMITIPKTMGFSNGMKLLDMMPTGYNHDYVNELFRTLGESGREVYLTKQIPVDMIYPLLFGLSYSLLLAYFLKKLNKLKSPFTYLCLLPIVAGMSDYLENIGIIIMLNSYPEVTQTMAKTTNIFTILKSGSTTLFFIVLITMVLLIGFKAMSRKK